MRASAAAGAADAAGADEGVGADGGADVSAAPADADARMAAVTKEETMYRMAISKTYSCDDDAVNRMNDPLMQLICWG